MKNLLLLVFGLFYLNIFSQNINIEVTYNKALKKISDKSTSPPRILKGLNYILKGNKNASIFKFQKGLQIEGNLNRRFIGIGGGGGINYKNLKENIKQEQRVLEDKFFIINDEVLKYKWNISKESKHIGKYLCYKAIANYQEYNPISKKRIDFTITAWFTPEISLPYGPSGYDGLPGLVIEVQKGGVYFIASKIKIDKNSKKIIKPLKKGKKVSLKEFNQIVYKKMESSYGKNFYEKRKKN